MQIIRKISTPDQWRYVESCNNPADQATRGLQAKDLTKSDWLNGPEFLRDDSDIPISSAEQATLSAEDPEVRKEVKSRVTSLKPQESNTLGDERFTRFSSWSSLRCAIAVLIVKVRLFKQKSTCNEASQSKPEQRLSPKVLTHATETVIKAVQKEAFQEEFDVITCTTSKDDNDRNSFKARKKTLKKSHLYRLDPYVDDTGILRVGGRLRQTNLSLKEKHPVLLPKEHHVSKLLVRHYHEEVHHQGRQMEPCGTLDIGS